MSLVPNKLACVVESPNWNTLIPSCPKLPNNIDDSDDNEDDDLSPVPVESEEADYKC